LSAGCDERALVAVKLRIKLIIAIGKQERNGFSFISKYEIKRLYMSNFPCSMHVIIIYIIYCLRWYYAMNDILNNTYKSFLFYRTLSRTIRPRRSYSTLDKPTDGHISPALVSGSSTGGYRSSSPRQSSYTVSSSASELSRKSFQNNNSQSSGGGSVSSSTPPPVPFDSTSSAEASRGHLTRECSQSGDENSESNNCSTKGGFTNRKTNASVASSRSDSSSSSNVGGGGSRRHSHHQHSRFSQLAGVTEGVAIDTKNGRSSSAPGAVLIDPSSTTTTPPFGPKTETETSTISSSRASIKGSLPRDPGSGSKCSDANIANNNCIIEDNDSPKDSSTVGSDRSRKRDGRFTVSSIKESDNVIHTCEVGESESSENVERSDNKELESIKEESVSGSSRCPSLSHSQSQGRISVEMAGKVVESGEPGTSGGHHHETTDLSNSADGGGGGTQDSLGNNNPPETEKTDENCMNTHIIASIAHGTKVSNNVYTDLIHEFNIYLYSGYYYIFCFSSFRSWNCRCCDHFRTANSSVTSGEK